MSTDIQVETDFEILEKLVSQRELIVFNDDVNSFDHVIDTLIKVCRHERVQAMQCADLIHFKGKCDVKRGTFDDLRPMCEALLEKGLTAEIQ